MCRDKASCGNLHDNNIDVAMLSIKSDIYHQVLNVSVNNGGLTF